MPGQNYTLWQPQDDEEPEEELDIVEEVEDPPPHNREVVQALQCSETPQPHNTGAIARMACIMCLGCAVMCFLGIFIGRFIPKQAPPQCQRPDMVKESVSGLVQVDSLKMKDSAAMLVANIKKENIRSYLEEMSQINNDVLPYIEEKFRKFGYRVKKTSYWVTLSKPSQSKRNRIHVKYNNAATEDLNPVPEYLLQFLPYAFYSPAGALNTTVVFANHGDIEDLMYLHSKQINLHGQIIVVKLRKGLHLATVVRYAERFGVSGIVYFPDPAEFRGEGNGGLPYPAGTGLPSDGIYWGNVKITPGDPSSPNHPAFNLFDESSSPIINITNVLVQPVNLNTASKILALLGGIDAPTSWLGGMNAPYKLGGKWRRGSNVTSFIMEINNELVRTKITNMHMFFPAADATKVIHIGCHYDEWKPESADNPGSGLAAFLELGRAFMQAFPEGLDRQILFSAWDAEEFGSIGSIEFTQQFFSWIQATSVAYLNIDQEFLQGTGGVEVQATPLIREVFNKAASLIHWPHQNMTVLQKLLNTASHEKYFSSLESDSDCFSFAADHGIPSLELRVVGPNMSPSYSLYHTQYDKVEAVTKFLDPQFDWAHLITSLTGVVALILAQSEVVPVKFTTLSSMLLSEWENMKALHKETLSNINKDLIRMMDNIDGELSVLNAILPQLDSWYRSDLSNKKSYKDVEERLQTYMNINKHFLHPYKKEFSYLPKQANTPTFPSKAMIESSLITFGPDPINPEKHIAFPRLVSTLSQVHGKTKSWEDVKEELLYIFASLRSYSEILDVQSKQYPYGM